MPATPLWLSLALLLLLANNASCLNCVQCSGPASGQCGTSIPSATPCGNTNFGNTNFGYGGGMSAYCVKTVTEGYQPFITRMCSSTMMSGCSASGAGNVNVCSYSCSTDGCNGAMPATAKTSSLVALGLATLVLMMGKKYV